MKRAPLALVFALSMIPSAQTASLAGTWSGAGVALDHQGKTIKCEAVVLTITQTAAALNVASDFTCEGQKFSFPGNVDVKGTELFNAGAKVGTLTGDALDLTVKANNFLLQTNAKFTDKAMNLRAIVSIASNPPKQVLKFESALKR